MKYIIDSIFKVGSPIILLRNINPPKLFNGTRLAVKKMTPNLIEATILIGKAKGKNVLIPRIPMISTNRSLKFKRLQFPVRLSFATTINKAQGQTLQICGVNLEESCFLHGQCYVRESILHIVYSFMHQTVKLETFFIQMF